MSVSILPKNKYVIYLALIAIGFIVGYKSKPARVVETDNSNEYEKVINNLKSKIEKMSNENLKENVKTVTIEKPDGTKVTTKTRATEKNTNVTKITQEKDNSKNTKSLKIERKTETINSENLNAVGLKYQYSVTDFSLSPAAYVQASMKCFIFRCYVEGQYLITDRNIMASAGIELRF